MINITHRPRRNRATQAIRDLIQENFVTLHDLMYPLFLVDGEGKKEAIASMPGQYRWSIDTLLNEIEECISLGVKAFVLFPNIAEKLKDAQATESWNESGLYLRAIRAVKQRFPHIVLMTDVAMDPYSSDGHDGVVLNNEIINDLTLPILARMAIAQAEAGADIIGPSDMMDGRIGYLRQELDEAGYANVSIMSYTAKYASAFYGPFRDALDSAPKFGDKKTYQMNPANSREALIEAELDVMEGADYLMVKPALPYLDIIQALRNNNNLPIAAYNVSGEYAMIKAAAEKGWLDGTKSMIESLTSIKRAGADIILTYFAKEYAQYLHDNKL